MDIQVSLLSIDIEVKERKKETKEQRVGERIEIFNKCQ
jgi:transposase